METLIEKYADKPLFLIIAVVLWFAGKYGEKLVARYLDKRTVRVDQVDAEGLMIKQQVAEIAADLDAEKVFLIYHFDEDQCYSVLHEYTKRLKKIEDEYQRVPYDDKARWAIDLLQSRGRIIANTLNEVEHEKHRHQMSQLGINSWYCFKLTMRGRVIGSLNIYFAQEYGMSSAQADALIGRLSLLGKLLYKSMKE